MHKVASLFMKVMRRFGRLNNSIPSLYQRTFGSGMACTEAENLNCMPSMTSADSNPVIFGAICFSLRVHIINEFAFTDIHIITVYRWHTLEIRQLHRLFCRILKHRSLFD